MLTETSDQGTGLTLIADGLIDTPLKLRAVTFFAQFPHHYETAARLAGWLGEQRGAELDAALDELVAAGLLERSPAEGPARYRLAHTPEHREALGTLADTYHDPYRRGLVEAYIRIVSSERGMRQVAVLAA
jgi:DNA-binding MarR family transcriptional regulator